MRSEIFPEMPAKSRHCGNVKNVDNVDKSVEKQSCSHANPSKYEKRGEAGGIVGKYVM